MSQDINWAFTVLPNSAYGSGANNSVDQTNLCAKGVRLYLVVTAVSGTDPTLDVKVQTKDPVSGKYEDLPGATFAQKTAVSQDSLTIYPGIAETGNETVSDVLDRTWRTVSTVGGTATPTVTHTIGASYIV